MKNFREIISSVPIPICGIALGFLVFGNVIRNQIPAVCMLCGIMGMFLLFMILAKGICFPRQLIKELNNPVLLSVSGTFPMALEIMTTYIVSYVPRVAFAIWMIGVILHVTLIIVFMKRYLLKFDLNKVYGSWYITFVGIIAASVSSPVHGMQFVGRTLWFFGMLAFVVLFGVVSWRYLRKPDVEILLQPLFCISAAPASLCLVGYMQAFETKSASLIVILLGLSYGMYLLSLIHCIRHLRIRFTPSLAAFTFPFVISSNASRVANAYFGNNAIINLIAFLQIMVAGILLLYVLMRYFKNIMKSLFAKSSDI